MNRDYAEQAYRDASAKAGQVWNTWLAARVREHKARTRLTRWWRSRKVRQRAAEYQRAHDAALALREAFIKDDPR